MADRTRNGSRPGGRQPARGKTKRVRRRRDAKVVAEAGPLVVREVAELEELRRELERVGATPLRWNADQEQRAALRGATGVDARRVRAQLLERQAIRRMETGTLTEQQTEDVGRALMKLEETLHDIASRFGISPDELNLDLGPVGKLM